LLNHKLKEWGLLEAFYGSLRENWHKYYGHGVMTYHHLEVALKTLLPSDVAFREKVQEILAQRKGVKPQPSVE
jgi:hypothetical protein